MKISVETHSNTNIILIAGAMDAVGIHENADTFHDATCDNDNDLTVDLKDVSFIDTSGLGLLVAALKRARANGGSLTLENVSGQPLELFTGLKLNTAFSIKEKREISPAAARAAMWTIDREAA